jgi:cytidine deaminase
MDDELIERAREVQKRAYAPYSHFPVGAALRTDDGTIVVGVNVENASYPLGCCAERVAVYSAVAQGHQHFVRIAIVGPGPEVITPCGGCRQVLREFGDLEIVMAEASGVKEPRIMRLADLLPLSFGKGDMDGV